MPSKTNPIELQLRKNPQVESNYEAMSQCQQSFYQGATILDSESVDQPESQQKRSPYQRGPYRRYSSQEKEKLTELFQHGLPIRTISEMFAIPKRNLLRWRKSWQSKRLKKADQVQRIGESIQTPQLDHSVQIQTMPPFTVPVVFYLPYRPFTWLSIPYV